MANRKKNQVQIEFGQAEPEPPDAGAELPYLPKPELQMPELDPFAWSVCEAFGMPALC